MNPVTMTDSIRPLPKDQWDSLAEDNVFAGYGWLLTVEESLLKCVLPKYFIFEDSGWIRGAAICYLFPGGVKMISPDDPLLGRLKKFANLLGISFLPAMVCGPLKGHGKHILLGKNLDPSAKEGIAEKLLDAVEKEARTRNLPVCFQQVCEPEEILVRQLRRRGYLKTLDLPVNYLDIPWDSFDGYKQHIRKLSLNMKKNIAKEINKNRRAGVVIEKVTDLYEHEMRLYDLINGNHLKHNKMSLPFNNNFLGRLKENLGEDMVVYRSLKEGKMSGATVMLKKRNVSYFFFVGVDHSLAQNDATYFNISFYRPIADAIAENTKRIYYGNGLYRMKARRGCKIKKTYIFQKSFHPISKWACRLWFPFHSFWYRRKLPQP